MKRGEEKILVQRSLGGDVEAFGELVNEYKSRIYATAFQMLGNYTDANDLSQEAFIKAYQSLEGFKEDSNFYTWIYRIVINLCINYIKKRNRIHLVSLDKGIGFKLKAETNQELLPLEVKEMRKSIFEAIDSLSLPLRTALVLVVFQGLTHRDAAEVEGCSEGTISWRIFKARRYLRKKLAGYL